MLSRAYILIYKEKSIKNYDESQYKQSSWRAY